MIGLGRLDQLPIGVDTDHDMPASGQFGANSSRPAAGIQHTRPAREHRIEQPGLPAKVHPLGGHPAEPFDVPLGMTDAVRRDPTRQLTHPTTVAGHAPTPATANAPATSTSPRSERRTSRISTVAKPTGAHLRRTPGLVSDDETRRFSRAVARKFGRSPFPDEVSPWLRPLEEVVSSRTRKAASPEGQALRQVVELRVEATGGWVAAPYDLTLVVIVEPGTLPT